ncbi:hypothetical protein PINS_up004972 [Pythium insidiosum]|nr:hypothetical protein PINS_up004972 [Pythium insidiosum]
MEETTPSSVTAVDTWAAASPPSPAPAPAPETAPAPAPVAKPATPTAATSAPAVAGAIPPVAPTAVQKARAAVDASATSHPSAEAPHSSAASESQRLAEMYKAMADRLESEKNELLRILADQTEQFYQMQDYINSLEREVTEYRARDTSAPSS